MKAITARNNICTIQSYHTYSAVVLRPPINGTDNQMPQVSVAPRSMSVNAMSFCISMPAFYFLQKMATHLNQDAFVRWGIVSG